jgi:predicted  nucleic acid-binding Zn-ribbon protein
MPANEDWDPKVLKFIASTVESIRDRVAGIENRMGSFENRMNSMENRMHSMENRMDAGFTAVRGDIERVHLRLDSIERMLSARLDRVETEVSRLRSVVYLLVKDRPELLRLLGETSIS